MRPITVRLDDDVEKELDYLAEIMHASKNKVINGLIRQEFDKYESDPVLKEKVNQLNELKSILEDFGKKLGDK